MEDREKAAELKALARAFSKMRKDKRRKATEKRELTETKGERMAERRKEKAASLTRAG